MKDWNVVVSTFDEGYRGARRTLRRFGEVDRTSFHNVLVMKVADVEQFVEAFAKLVAETPGVLNDVSRVVPAMRTIDFADRAEFVSRAREVVMGWLPQLANKRFYVRMHRRGLRSDLNSHVEERFLDTLLLEALAAAGTPGRMSFDDPEVVIAIETVGNRAGVSLWSCAQLDRYPFLRIG